MVRCGMYNALPPHLAPPHHISFHITTTFCMHHCTSHTIPHHTTSDIIPNHTTPHFMSHQYLSQHTAFHFHIAVSHQIAPSHFTSHQIAATSCPISHNPHNTTFRIMPYIGHIHHTTTSCITPHFTQHST